MHQPNKWKTLAAELEAEQGFYRALAEQAERAKRGEAPLPEVPPHAELTFADGFLIWKGRPVWWSGKSASTTATQGLAGPGLVNPPVLVAPSPARTRESTRPRLHRWFGLPWRWA